MTTCRECVRCSECGVVAFCEADTVKPPCPHDERLCADCLTSCEECLVTVLAEVPC